MCEISRFGNGPPALRVNRDDPSKSHIQEGAVVIETMNPDTGILQLSASGR
jgi:hypothetical protein